MQVDQIIVCDHDPDLEHFACCDILQAKYQYLHIHTNNSV